MLTIDTYLRPESLEEAYEAVQKKNSAVLGGMLWLRLGNRRIGTAIDLSALGLDQVEDAGNAWKIGAYTTLRTMEMHTDLQEEFHGVLRNCVSSIVGVQFRNLATVGGSVFGRYGFSDIVTTFLALDASVEMYKHGIVSLEEFCGMGNVKDILTHIHLPKFPAAAAYCAQRNTATDFPVLNTCAVLRNTTLTVTVGARPLRAVPFRFEICNTISAAEQAESIAKQISENTIFASNARASAEYRQHLCHVLVRRAVLEVLQKKEAE